MKLSEINRRRQERLNRESISYLFILNFIKHRHLDATTESWLLAISLKSEARLSCDHSKSINC
jgi:hypothetical protein